MITFDMEVVTSRTPAAFVQALFEYIDVQADKEVFDEITELHTENFNITTFEGARDAISSELGIKPTVFIEFRPKLVLDTDIIAVKRLISAVDRWLHTIQNDFVLVYNGESVMMYRKSGQLRVNQASKGWTPARLSLLTYPYKTVSMPAIRDVADD